MQSIRSVFSTAVLPATLVVVSAYQILMGVNGPEGRERAEQLAEELAASAAEIAALEAERARLEAHADKLMLANLDEDLLEERVRANLGHMRPGEYRIPASELDALAAQAFNNEAELTRLIAVALIENQDV